MAAEIRHLLPVRWAHLNNSTAIPPKSPKNGASQFGLDSSVKVNMMSVVHATTTAVNLTRSVAKVAGK